MQDSSPNSEIPRLPNVAQPPSAVHSDVPSHFYRRNLPHYQAPGGSHFVSFCTKDRWILPEPARDLALKHVLHDRGHKFGCICAVVMPDHVHLVYAPTRNPSGRYYSLEEILGPIKGASSHSINNLLGRSGSVWQDESFDHVLRSRDSAIDKIMYVLENPVRKGLRSDWRDWPWAWANPDLKVPGAQPRAAVPHC